MRIACLHLPGFILQVHVRAAPHLAGTAFGVLGATAGKVARLEACSRRALAEGVTIGMTATQARAAAPGLRLVDGDEGLVTQATEALGEALLALAVTVDAQQLGNIYAFVPPRGGDVAFARRVCAAAAGQGFVGRVGIADDRFTAWAATKALPRASVQVVPKNGAARFLSPLGLELLALSPDVERTLAILGIRTLGDFAALPPPSIGRRWARKGVDLQALARGEDRAPLQPFAPREAVRESVELEDEVHDLEPLVFLLRPLLERAAARLRGRGRAAKRTIVTLGGAPGTAATEVAVAPARPTTSARTLLDLARAHLAEQKLTHAIRRVEVLVAEEGEEDREERDLWDRAAPAPDAVDRTIARLCAAFGAEAACGVRLADRHRPEGAFERVPFALPPKKARAQPAASPMTSKDVGTLRLLAQPVLLGTPPRWTTQTGPLRLAGEWWTEAPFDRDYYEVEAADGAHYWVYRDHANGALYLHGVFD